MDVIHCIVCEGVRNVYLCKSIWYVCIYRMRESLATFLLVGDIMLLYNKLDDINKCFDLALGYDISALPSVTRE